MKVYLSETAVRDDLPEIKEYDQARADQIREITKELVLSACNEAVKNIDGELIVDVCGEFDTGRINTEYFRAERCFMFSLTFSSFGEANDARAKRRLFRRLKECRANWPDTKLLHLIPNFDGEKDIEEKAPIVELSFKIYLIKDNKLVDNGSCIIASGGQVCYNSVFQKITEAFREKYD